MKLEDFDYSLPAELVAQHPAPRRADSRMLVVHRAAGRWEDARFRQLPDFLKPGDVLALNNSRVLPARLFGHSRGVRSQPTGKRSRHRREHLRSPIEALLARRLDERTWEALVRPGRKVRVGERLVFTAQQPPAAGPAASVPVLEAEVVGRGEYGLRTLRFSEGVALEETLEKLGHVPLPPYIRRADEEDDLRRYQTVYAKHSGSVAAPTAGLHFSRTMLRELALHGVERAEITLHVGLGTFQPIHAPVIEQHRMHAESFRVSPAAAARLNRALEERRRIVAVGTTTVRTLEHLTAGGGPIRPGRGETSLFILPGFRFRAVGALLTNFHLPQTTLLMLVAAFGGRELVLAAYRHAVEQRYRFYSYGDCMLIL